jgi:hypothetical protein
MNLPLADRYIPGGRRGEITRYNFFTRPTLSYKLECESNRQAKYEIINMASNAAMNEDAGYANGIMICAIVTASLSLVLNISLICWPGCVVVSLC